MHNNNYCFYNPHVDDFLGEPPHFRLLKRRPLKKYGHLLNHSISTTGKFNVFIDSSISAFIPGSIFQFLPGPVRKLICEIEFLWWKRINNYQDKAQRLAKPDPNMNLLCFSFKSATYGFKKRKASLSKFSNTIFHLSHYFVNTQLKAKNLSELNNLFLAGDTDITENIYFKSFFQWYKKPFLIIPFAAADRFQCKNDFSQRNKFIIAIGTFHDLRQETPLAHYLDFMSFFNMTSYHPIRKTIYERQSEFEEIHCKVNPYRPIGAKRGLIPWLVSRFNVAQKSYFKIDIVDLYNQYQFAVIGEEAVGFPALGTFEAMACGCVYFGVEEFYKGLDLTPRVHYMPYNGTIEDLLEKKKELDEDPELALRISQNATEWVEKVRGPQLGQQFGERLVQLNKLV